MFASAVFRRSLPCAYRLMRQWSHVKLPVCINRSRKATSAPRNIFLGIISAAGVWTTLKDKFGSEKAGDSFKDLLKQAVVEMQNKNFLEAQLLLDKLLNMARQSGDDMGENLAYELMAALHTAENNLPSAEEMYDVLAQRLFSKSGTNTMYVEVLLKLAATYAAQHKIDQAEASYKRCINSQLQNVGGEKKLKEIVAKPPVQTLLHPLDPNAAKTERPESIELRRNLLIYANSLESYGLFLVAIERFKEAVRVLEQSIPVLKSAFGSASPAVILSTNMLGSAYVRAGEADQGIDTLRQVVYIAEKTPDCAPIVPGLLMNLAEALRQLKRFEDAKTASLRAYEAALTSADKRWAPETRKLLDAIEKDLEQQQKKKK